MYSRREFIRTTAAAAIVAPFIVKSSAIAGLGHVAPSDKINLGFIGCGSMGTENLNACVSSDSVALTAAADVWKARLDVVLNRFRDCKGYGNHRDLLNHSG
ncbi:MAG: hypothetical protein LBK58_05740, partial [Prevotellaceae bacterium]|nr:hypothetical protein [Prevotellaceae bacterium]